jgi:formylglycine-generating enzyme required for sulfatase activity
MSRQLSVFLSSLLIIGMMQLGCQEHAQSPKTISNSIGMEMVLIKHGNFIMGSPKTELGDGGKHIEDESPQHEVRISRDFYMAQTEVTQGQWKAIMGTEPWKGKEYVKEGENYPASYVSWFQAGEFCKKLSEQEEKQGRKYRLPTEAEWEYACRAGSKTAYSFGESSKSLGNYAWFNGNSNGQTHPVGEKRANAWGLYDMHGNVWEWCSDWYGAYPNGAVSDPVGPLKGSFRVLRGGCWIVEAALCQSAGRRCNFPSGSGSYYGFRVALSSPSGIPKSPEADSK